MKSSETGGKKKKLVQGVGVNDADYKVKEWKRFNGKQVPVWMCPFYQRWSGVLRRCYSKSYVHPAYLGCTVVDEWKTFTNFKLWMESQEWEGFELDKDILKPGNKEYGPENCVFVTGTTNSFIIDSAASRGKYPVGVTRHSNANVYQSTVSFKGKNIHLGHFSTPEEAHQAWRVAKWEQAILVAAEQTDPRVAEAILNRYRL